MIIRKKKYKQKFAKTLVCQIVCVILSNIGNENKQMWFATFNLQLKLWEWRWCYDRRNFIRNNIFTFVWYNCRNYYSICLNYDDYKIKQIDNKKTHL